MTDFVTTRNKPWAPRMAACLAVSLILAGALGSLDAQPTPPPAPLPEGIKAVPTPPDSPPVKQPVPPPQALSVPIQPMPPPPIRITISGPKVALVDQPITLKVILPIPPTSPR